MDVYLQQIDVQVNNNQKLPSVTTQHDYYDNNYGCSLEARQTPKRNKH